MLRSRCYLGVYQTACRELRPCLLTDTFECEMRQLCKGSVGSDGAMKDIRGGMMHCSNDNIVDLRDILYVEL